MNAESSEAIQHALRDSYNICRFCGEQSKKLIGIYSEEGIQNEIPKKIELYLPIKLSQSDELPLECCWDCVSIIHTWDKFLQKAVETTERLKNAKEKFEETKDFETNAIGNFSLTTSTNLYAFCPNVDDILLKKETPGDNLQLHCNEDAHSNDVTDIDEDISNYVDIQKEREEETKKCSVLEQNSTFVCHFCPEKFTSEEEVLHHTCETHPDAADSEESPNKTNRNTKRIRTKIDPNVINEAKVVVDDRVYYNCKECGKSLLSPYTYMWHMRIHTGERPFVCDLCGKQFRVSQGLVRHLKETHERIKNFPCDICGRMFATKRNVDEHRRIHTNERPYVCALCGKAFKQKASLFVHNRTHSDTFPYKCEYCNQGFRTKPPLLIHVTKHTGQKPYPCDVCGRCFRIKYELKRHKLVHSEEKPFSCSFCGLHFKQKRYLRNHFKVNHLNNIQLGAVSVL